MNWNNAKMWYHQHKPAIFMVAGGVTLTAGGVFVGVQTKKAVDILNAEKERRQVDKIPFKDAVGLTWRLYVPPVLMMAGGLGMLGESYASSMFALNSSMKLYEKVEGEYHDYVNGVKKVLGEKKRGEIEAAIAEKLLVDNPPPTEPPKEELQKIELKALNGEVTKNVYPIRDPMREEYFWSNKDRMDAIEAKLNLALMVDDWIPLNDFYDEIGWEHTTLGYKYGFKCNGSNPKDSVRFRLIAGQVTPDGTPAYVLRYDLFDQSGRPVMEVRE